MGVSCYFFVVMSRLLVVLLLVAFTLAQYELKQSIEGTWTDSRYGGKLYLCVDDDLNVWGTYSEAGVYWGKTTPDENFAKGRWYQAGNSACNSGNWEAFYESTDSNSLSFVVTCDFIGNQLNNFTETRFNGIATDAQCNVVYNFDDIDGIEGSWGNIQQDFGYIDFCVFDDDDEAHASFARVPAPGLNATVGYMTGQAMENHRIFQGDYSAKNPEDKFSSGNVLFFPRSPREAVMFLWPGPQIRKNGQHTINTQIQYRDNSPEQCEDNRFVIFPPGYVFSSMANSLSLSFALLICSAFVCLIL